MVDCDPPTWHVHHEAPSSFHAPYPSWIQHGLLLAAADGPIAAVRAQSAVPAKYALPATPRVPATADGSSCLQWHAVYAVVQRPVCAATRPAAHQRCVQATCGPTAGGVPAAAGPATQLGPSYRLYLPPVQTIAHFDGPARGLPGRHADERPIVRGPKINSDLSAGEPRRRHPLPPGHDGRK